MSKFAVGDRVRIRMAFRKELIGMIGMIVEVRPGIEGIEVYSVFIPDYPPCLLKGGRDNLSWYILGYSLESFGN